MNSRFEFPSGQITFYFLMEHLEVTQGRQPWGGGGKFENSKVKLLSNTLGDWDQYPIMKQRP
jgi:hypothetical protein